MNLNKIDMLEGTAHLLDELDSKYSNIGYFGGVKRELKMAYMQHKPEFCSSPHVNSFWSIFHNVAVWILEKLMVLLRDGRTLIGYLRSVDQFANLVLHETIERIYVGKEYGDIPRGIFIIRGENVVFLGEIVSFLVSACWGINILTLVTSFYILDVIFTLSLF